MKDNIFQAIFDYQIRNTMTPTPTLASILAEPLEPMPPHVSPRRPNETELGYSRRIADAEDRTDAIAGPAAIIRALEAALTESDEECWRRGERIAELENNRDPVPEYTSELNAAAKENAKLRAAGDALVRDIRRLINDKVADSLTRLQAAGIMASWSAAIATN